MCLPRTRTLTRWIAKFDTGSPAIRSGLPLTRVVDRPALQATLKHHLGPDHLHFGRSIIGYEILKNGTVAIDVSDGTRTYGDVLVGADGIWSVVRAKMMGEKWSDATKPGYETSTYSGFTVFTGVCKHRYVRYAAVDMTRAQADGMAASTDVCVCVCVCVRVVC